jgi:hypothetical protein
LYHDDSDCVSWYKSEEEHNDHVKINNHGISEEFKIAIDSIYELYQAPSRIKRELIRMFPDLAKESFPTEQKLINYIKYRKRKKGKSRLNLGEFEEWCSKHDKIPDDPDEMFVKRSFTVDKITHKVSFCLIFQSIVCIYTISLI